MFDTFSADEFIGDFFDDGRFATHEQYFQAIVMIQMHMHG